MPFDNFVFENFQKIFAAKFLNTSEETLNNPKSQEQWVDEVAFPALKNAAVPKPLYSSSEVEYKEQHRYAFDDYSGVTDNDAAWTLDVGSGSIKGHYYKGKLSKRPDGFTHSVGAYEQRDLGRELGKQDLECRLHYKGNAEIPDSQEPFYAHIDANGAASVTNAPPKILFQNDGRDPRWEEGIPLTKFQVSKVTLPPNLQYFTAKAKIFDRHVNIAVPFSELTESGLKKVLHHHLGNNQTNQEESYLTIDDQDVPAPSQSTRESKIDAFCKIWKPMPVKHSRQTKMGNIFFETPNAYTQFKEGLKNKDDEQSIGLLRDWMKSKDPITVKKGDGANPSLEIDKSGWQLNLAKDSTDNAALPQTLFNESARIKGEIPPAKKHLANLLEKPSTEINLSYFVDKDFGRSGLLSKDGRFSFKKEQDAYLSYQDDQYIFQQGGNDFIVDPKNYSKHQSLYNECAKKPLSIGFLTFENGGTYRKFRDACLYGEQSEDIQSSEGKTGDETFTLTPPQRGTYDRLLAIIHNAEKQPIQIRESKSDITYYNMGEKSIFFGKTYDIPTTLESWEQHGNLHNCQGAYTQGDRTDYSR